MAQVWNRVFPPKPLRCLRWGALYFHWRERCLALEVETGAILWEYNANLDSTISTVCCGWVNRGVALGAGRVYMGQLDAKLVALDQATGEVDWSIQAEEWREGYTLTSAPTYFDGKAGHYRFCRRETAHSRPHSCLMMLRPATWSGTSTPFRPRGAWL